MTSTSTSVAASGPAANGAAPLGWPLLVMLSGTFLAVLFIPLFFVVVMRVFRRGTAS